MNKTSGKLQACFGGLLWVFPIVMYKFFPHLSPPPLVRCQLHPGCPLGYSRAFARGQLSYCPCTWLLWPVTSQHNVFCPIDHHSLQFPFRPIFPHHCPQLRLRAWYPLRFPLPSSSCPLHIGLWLLCRSSGIFHRAVRTAIFHFDQEVRGGLLYKTLALQAKNLQLLDIMKAQRPKRLPCQGPPFWSCLSSSPLRPTAKWLTIAPCPEAQQSHGWHSPQVCALLYPWTLNMFMTTEVEWSEQKFL